MFSSGRRTGSSRTWATLERCTAGRSDMLKGGLLWLLGIPIPILIVLLLVGVL
jgi:hypothetical protein